MILFHDKENGAYPYTDAQTKQREALGAAIGKAVQTALTAQANDPTDKPSGVGAHLTEARNKGTEAQAKKWARQGRTMMVELAIPVPALTIALPGGGNLKTKPYTVLFNAILDTPKPAEEKKAPEAKQAPELRAMTMEEIIARQQSYRTAGTLQ